MTLSSTTLWTLAELGQQVAQALAVDYGGAPNQRVRAVPDPRTIRYYTTIGLLDRPTEVRGKLAYYGLRHLQQLVAIKRLQAEGLSLAQVQQRLLGLPNAQLARLAKLPSPAPSPVQTPTVPPMQTPSVPPREAFWSAPPAPVPTPTPTSASTSTNPCTNHWQTLALLPRTLLVFDSARTLNEDDLTALQAAALPLLRELQSRHLLPSS